MDFQSINLDGFSFGDTADIAVDELSSGDIAIIGIGLKLPLADTAEQFWRNLRTGKDCVRDIPEGRKADADRYFRHIGRDVSSIQYGEAAYLEEIDKFDYAFFKMSPREARLLDPNQRMFLQVAWNAIEDAGYGGDRLAGSRTGVYLGYGSDADYKRMIAEVEPESVSMSMPGNVRPIIASRLSYYLDLKGPSFVVDTTCSSSLVAVHLACQGLIHGECDAAIAGGIQLHLLPVREFEVGVESSTGRTRTFDDGSDGTGTGEGAVAIVLKPLYKAQEDGDSIYAVIKGSALNQDGSSVGITAPNADAQADVMADAWKRSGVDPATITYIEAHGTGTRLGDPIEVEGIQKAFRRYTDNKQFCAISALKSNIGHLDNTAGIAGLVKAVLSLQHGELFPTLHLSRPNRKIAFEESPVYINDRLSRWEPQGDKRRCGVSSFGISGTNCHVVLEEAPAAAGEAAEPLAAAELFVLSAKTESALENAVKAYADYLQTHTHLNIKDVSFTVCTGRGHYPHRLALAARSAAELAAGLHAALRNGLREAEGTGLFFSSLSRRLNDAPAAPAAVDAALRNYAAEGGSEQALRELCRLYACGADLKWEPLFQNEKRVRLHLPAYPFDASRCWLQIPAAAAAEAPEQDAALYCKPVWELEEVRPGSAGPGQSYLIFADGRGVGSQLAELLRREGSKAVCVRLGAQFERLNDEAYTIQGSEDDYHRLFAALQGERMTRIVHLLAFSERAEPDSLEELEQNLHSGAYSLLHVMRAWSAAGFDHPAELLLAADYASEVTAGQPLVKPENAALFGLGKAIGWEARQLRVRCIDMEQGTDAATLLNELHAEGAAYKAAYRNGQRYTERIGEADLAAEPAQPVELQRTGIYVITGGLGGIGLHAAKLLASRAAAQLALVNRTAFPQRSEWDAVLSSGADRKACARIQAIRAIEQTGAQVHCFRADVADEAQLRGLVRQLRSEFGAIRGIIHAAGLGEGNYLRSLTAEEMQRILAPKVRGTWLLDRLAVREETDFMLLFSSAITLVGGVGSGPYAAANAYLDAFAAYRSRQGAKTQAINWPAWDNTGLAEGQTMEEEKELFKVLPPEKGVQAMSAIMDREIAQVIVGEWNRSSTVLKLGELLPFAWTSALRDKLRPQEPQAAARAVQAPAATVPAVRLTGKGGSDYTEIEKQIAQVWKHVLGYDELDVNDNFFEIGGDSILIAKVHERIAELFPGQVTISDLFTHYTVARTAAYISGLTAEAEASAAQTGPDNGLERELAALFDRLNRGELSIDQAVSMFRHMEVAHG